MKNDHFVGDRTRIRQRDASGCAGPLSEYSLRCLSRCSVRRLSTCLAVLLLLVLSAGASAFDSSSTPNGFSLADSAISPEEIIGGGVRRDSIPALDDPPHVKAADAPWRDRERVIGVRLGDEARAYPIAILVWHELVNDVLDGRPILASYCPLCGTGIVFDRRPRPLQTGVGASTTAPIPPASGKGLRFGVSGLLYRSDLLMYDRETESLWPQISGEAVTGSSRGRRLRQIRSQMTTWGEWRERHPDTTVLSLETGHRRRYGSTPYGGYANSDTLMFPVAHDRRYSPKMPTLGLRLSEGHSRAYPAIEVERAGGRVEEEFAGRPVVVSYDASTRLFQITVADEIEVVEGYWFAWMAFHPGSSVYAAP